MISDDGYRGWMLLSKIRSKEFVTYRCYQKSPNNNIIRYNIHPIVTLCTILLEKITGGPSGPLAIIYFFQKKRTDTHTNTKTG
jgi:hypothetical protein